MTAAVAIARSSDHPIAGPDACAQSDRELLSTFLRAYWLRPENALWMYLRSRTLAHVPLAGPCVDISCGDGVFTFLHLGGRFAPEFDVFTAVAVPSGAIQGHADMFDCGAEGYRPPIVATPHRQVDVGADLKPNLLSKAAALNLYQRLVKNDNNDPLPFPSESFVSVYCNAAYWVTRIDRFLSELRRVLRPGGHVVLQVKLRDMDDYTLERFRGALGERFLAIIGRGRRQCWPTLADRPTWERRFAAAGLQIADAVPFVTQTHAHIWDVGLRPIAPLLVRMTEALTPTTRVSIKNEWVDLWCELLTPFCDPGLDLFGGPAEPAEMQYVLTS